jgi:hypothetical protein
MGDANKDPEHKTHELQGPVCPEITTIAIARPGRKKITGKGHNEVLEIVNPLELICIATNAVQRHVPENRDLHEARDSRFPERVCVEEHHCSKSDAKPNILTSFSFLNSVLSSQFSLLRN